MPDLPIPVIALVIAVAAGLVALPAIVAIYTRKHRPILLVLSVVLAAAMFAVAREWGFMVVYSTAVGAVALCLGLVAVTHRRTRPRPKTANGPRPV